MLVRRFEFRLAAGAPPIGMMTASPSAQNILLLLFYRVMQHVMQQRANLLNIAGYSLSSSVKMRSQEENVIPQAATDVMDFDQCPCKVRQRGMYGGQDSIR